MDVGGRGRAEKGLSEGERRGEESEDAEAVAGVEARGLISFRSSAPSFPAAVTHSVMSVRVLRT